VRKGGGGEGRKNNGDEHAPLHPVPVVSFYSLLLPCSCLGSCPGRGERTFDRKKERKREGRERQALVGRRRLGPSPFPRPALVLRLTSTRQKKDFPARKKREKEGEEEGTSGCGRRPSVFCHSRPLVVATCLCALRLHDKKREKE